MSSNIQTIHALCEAFVRWDVPFLLSHLDDNVAWEVEAPAILSFGGIRHVRDFDGRSGHGMKPAAGFRSSDAKQRRGENRPDDDQRTRESS